MAGLSDTLQIAKGTLLNTQTLLQTVSNNIANADSTTYSRQVGVTATNSPILTGGLWMGTGASVVKVVQQRDDFIERRLMDSTSQSADFDTRAQQLSLAGNYLSDDGSSGISQALGNFWDAWSNLNANPTGTAEAGLVKQAAGDLASTVSSTYNNLFQQAGTVQDELASRVSDANGLLSDIANYNAEITKAEAGGAVSPANDLRDQRYDALTKLANLLPIKYQEQPNGMVDVWVKDDSGDIQMVKDNQAGSVSYDNPTNVITSTDTDGTSQTLSPTLGTIKALQDVYVSIGTSHDYDYVLSNPNDASLTYLDRLNAFAASLVNEVNTAHAQAGGTEVFDSSVLTTGFNASQLTVSPNFAPDSSEALNVADVQNKGFTETGGLTFQQYLSDIQQRLGAAQNSAATQSSFYDALHQQLQTQQQSASGVSIDEEMVNLLKYQQVYQTAAKIVQSTSQMFDFLIQSV